MKKYLSIALCLMAVTGCSSDIRNGSQSPAQAPQGYTTPVQSESVGVYKVGNPYYVRGIRYVPHEDTTYDETGIASWYGSKFHGRRTANGEVFDMYQLSAAHRTLPMPSQVRVTNLQNGRSLILRVNDRGPFVGDRIIDLSFKAAQELDFVRQGTTKVRVEYHSPAVGAAAKPKVSKLELEALDEEQRLQASRPPTTGTAKEVASQELTPPPETKEPARQATSQLEERQEIHLQIGAFSSSTNAARMRDEMSSYYAAHIRGATVNEQQIYRVRMGPFPTTADAHAMLARLENAGFSGGLITIEKFLH